MCVMWVMMLASEAQLRVVLVKVLGASEAQLHVVLVSALVVLVS